MLALLAALAILGDDSKAAAAAPDLEAVPFVGCNADGMVGFNPAPGLPPRPPPRLEAQADRLTYYASEGMGVLAPRGWHCAEVYGSNVAVLVVTPQVIAQDDLYRIMDLKTGPIIRLEFWNAYTSGRSEVARITARLFPSKRALVDEIIELETDLGLTTVQDYPVGPHPGDLITRRSDVDVEFVTPAGMTGIGTGDGLLPDGEPITGLALSGNDGVTILKVRLPPDLQPLSAAIIQKTRGLQTQ